MILSTPSTRCWLSVKDKYPHQSGQDFPFDWGLGFFLKEKIDQMKSDCFSTGIHITGSFPIVPRNMKIEQQPCDGNVSESIKKMHGV